MKFLLSTLLLSFIFINSSLLANDVIKLGYINKDNFSYQSTIDIMINIMSKKLNEDLPKNENINFTFHMYKTYEELYNDYENLKINSIVISPNLYFDNKNELDETSNKWTLTPKEKTYEQFYLIKNNTLKLDFNDLSKITVLARDASSSSKLWFDNILLEKLKNNYKEKKVINIKKEYKLIHNVFFDKYNISIINKKTYDYMLELNPQIKKKISIIEKSKAIFFPIIGLYQKEYNNGNHDPIYRNINNFNNKLKDQTFMTLTNYSIKFAKNDYVKPYYDFYNRYTKLKEKYAK